MDLQQQRIDTTVGLLRVGVAVLARVIARPRPAQGSKSFSREAMILAVISSRIWRGLDILALWGGVVVFYQEINTADVETEGDDFAPRHSAAILRRRSCITGLARR